MTSPSAALARTPDASLTGTSRDPRHVTALLERAAKAAHVVTPVTVCPDLPEGLSVAVTSVLVHPSEVYDIPGGSKVGLAKSALDRIGMALGISWDPRESRRVDDGRTKHYAAFQAVGSYPLWDGSRGTCTGTKEVDLRDGSPAALAMSEKQLAGARLHVLALAESKAKNRAIRSLGIKPAYSREEVKLPFVCARALFTGETSDPELRREFALMRAQSFFAARTALYGGAPPPALLPGRPAPPVGEVVDHDEDGVIDTAAAPAAASQPRAPAHPSGFTIPGGRAKGTALEDAEERDLTYWADRIEGDLAEGKTREAFVERDTELARAMRGELARRLAGEPLQEEPAGEDDIPF